MKPNSRLLPGLSKQERKAYRTFLLKNKKIYQPLTQIKVNAGIRSKPSFKKRASRRLLSNGYSVDQEWAALSDCWLGLKISKNNEDMQLQQWYAAGIQRFCNDLGLFVPSFPELKLAALSFYKDNAEWLPADISGQEIIDLMLKNDYEFLKKQLEEREYNQYMEGGEYNNNESGQDESIS